LHDLGEEKKQKLKNWGPWETFNNKKKQKKTVLVYKQQSL
jgi:hypothetical protein